jgi:hypothetical protein
MRVGLLKFALVFLIACLLGCKGMPSHPRGVPSSAVWVDNVFIDCYVDTQGKANRCTVYKDTTGEILADGLFVLSSSRREADKSELRFAAFGERGIYLQDARILVQREASRRDPSYRIIDERLKAIASRGGIEALDCNSATAKSNVPAECALKAYANNQPFYVRFYLQYPDAFRQDGFARDGDGNVYEVWFLPGNMVMTGQFPKEAQLLDANRTVVMPCPKPTRLSNATNGTLSCARPVV